MTDRDTILNAVKTALAPIKERKELPQWDAAIATSLPAQSIQSESDKVNLFLEQFKAVNGVPVIGLDGLADYLKTVEVSLGYCIPEWVQKVREVVTQIKFHDKFDRTIVDEYGVGITVASAGIAETGTIILKDSETPSRLSALAPWIHVAILSRSKLFSTVTEAVESFDKDPSIIFITGPSKTADIEGILIEGVHGPGVQVCCLVD